MPVEVIALRHEFVNRRIDELQLRRWWIAEQLGVSRRTFRRWLGGETRQVPRHAVQKLAELLQSSVAELADSAATRYASADDQLRAARAMLDSNLLEHMMPSHQWALYEKLARGLVLENLSKQELARLTMAISLALFRQGKLDDAFCHAERAAGLATDCGDRETALRAAMLKSYQEYRRGNLALAIEQDEVNLACARALGIPRLIAANLSNLADLVREQGDIERSIALQRDAIALYEREAMMPNLAFCHLGLVMAYLDANGIGDAMAAVAAARVCVGRASFRRGFPDCDQFEALVAVRAGDTVRAVALVERALTGYAELEIEEERNYINAAKVYCAADEVRTARRLLVRARDLARVHHSPLFERKAQQALDALSPRAP